MIRIGAIAGLSNLSRLNLDDFSLAMRRGQYHDAFNLPAEAVRYCEQVLRLPASTASLIRGYDAGPQFGPSQEVVGNSTASGVGGVDATAPVTSIPEPDGDPPEPGPRPDDDPTPGWRRWTQARIPTMAAVTNNVGAKARAHLASLDLPDGTLAPDEQIFSVARQLKSISLEVEMTKWASERLKASLSGQEPPALLFLLGRTDEALARLETRWKTSGSVSAGFWADWDTGNWRERFAGLGKQPHRQFLESLSATGTRSANSRMNTQRQWGVDDGLVGERGCSGAWAAADSGLPPCGVMTRER